MFELMFRLLQRLGRDGRGNSVLTIALGLPALIGATGFGIDTAQWYLWKSELQQAVDNAAVAGAEARADARTAQAYKVHAARAFGANLGLIKDIVSKPTIELNDYGKGRQNLVIVSATVSDRLLFSSLISRSATTVRAEASAIFGWSDHEASCLISRSPAARGAVLYRGGKLDFDGCGAASLSEGGESGGRVPQRIQG
ncbi:hypothetical protein B2G71_18370 [Novosphingobium sp. PC22D]|uniref:TadE/TadG family type IV pilus assembly protein n=1 Tax=Novosphingobium sp. PC22D TaxID=1962403 RepID=UPI000BEF3549|nr:pilus assembly protein TadG-related protein [Novosphingobium sp. PC22D]PEQ11250.1 hypothetical protein B2G71_18370 [Novosphingobium sp. PC22D]